MVAGLEGKDESKEEEEKKKMGEGKERKNE